MRTKNREYPLEILIPVLVEVLVEYLMEIFSLSLTPSVRRPSPVGMGVEMVLFNVRITFECKKHLVLKESLASLLLEIPLEY